MPPRRFSRYCFSLAIKDASGKLFLTDIEPFRYQALPDNLYHTVELGDTLWSLAPRAWPNLQNAEWLWWIAGHFQPQPIHDPTIALEVGYESPSQFSREYNRLFGAPRLRDIANLRQMAEGNSRQETSGQAFPGGLLRPDLDNRPVRRQLGNFLYFFVRYGNTPVRPVALPGHEEPFFMPWIMMSPPGETPSSFARLLSLSFG